MLLFSRVHLLFVLMSSSSADLSLSKQLGIPAHILAAKEKTGRTVKEVSDDRFNQLSSLASGDTAMPYTAIFPRTDSFLWMPGFLLFHLPSDSKPREFYSHNWVQILLLFSGHSVPELPLPILSINSCKLALQALQCFTAFSICRVPFKKPEERPICIQQTYQ